MPIRPLPAFQHFEDLDPRQRDFQSGITNVLGFHSSPYRNINRASSRLGRSRSARQFNNHTMRTRPRIRHFCLIGLLIAASSGCSLIHRVDINQGNIVTQEMVNQLRPGMNRRQVTYLLGTPLLTDPFHDNEWDYIYSIEPNGEPREERKLTLTFERDELIRLEGDYRPGSPPEFDAGKDATIYVPKLEREKTVWEKVESVFGLDDD